MKGSGGEEEECGKQGGGICGQIVRLALGAITAMVDS